MVEQWFCNPQVIGSSPIGGSNKIYKDMKKIINYFKKLNHMKLMGYIIALIIALNLLFIYITE